VSDWYILNEDKTVTLANPEDVKIGVYNGLDGEDRILAQEQVGQAWVSTVFLGLDYSFGIDRGAPVLFETMVFRNDSGNDSGEECERYCTYQEAVDGHKRMVASISSGLSREELEAAMAVITPLLNTPDKC